MSGVSTTDDVLHAARALGFALVGVVEAAPSAHVAFFENWLAKGRHGEMHYLAAHLEKRIDPRTLLPGARAVICVADRYPTDMPHPASDEQRGPRGRIARYAWGDDYHTVIKRRLHELADKLRAAHPDEQFRAAVDTAPILEREHADRAGLGWVGKHTLLIHPREGSYLLLGQIVTTLALTPGTGREQPITTDHCGTCTRCIDACPTQCITPYSVDASRCISYLTIEHRDVIDPAMHEAMGDWIAGCDICQEVCPHNGRDRGTEGPRDQGADDATHGPPFSRDVQRSAGAAPQAAHHPAYTPRPPAPALALLDILNWSAADRSRVLRKSALKRIKLDMWKRNALIAAGNALRRADDADLRARVVALADDANEAELVRRTARDVLDALEADRGQR